MRGVRPHEETGMEVIHPGPLLRTVCQCTLQARNSDSMRSQRPNGDYAVVAAARRPPTPQSHFAVSGHILAA